MALYRDKMQNEVGDLLQVWVSLGFRGSEVARELLVTTIRWCEENGIQRILATLTRGNDRALKFYGEHGFVSTHLTSCVARSEDIVLVRSINVEHAPAEDIFLRTGDT